MLVNIREVYERVVEAESIKDAKKKWYEGDVLNDSDFKEVTFTDYEEEKMN